MANREHELIQDLRAARLKQAEAALAESAAKSVWLERKADSAKAAALVEEILLDIQTGTTGRPLIDYAETADERQRGPTAAEPEPESPAPKPKRKRGKADPPAPAADPTKEWAALQLIVAHSLRQDERTDWDEFVDLGWIGDADLLDTLREIWSSSPTRIVSDRGEYVIRGGDNPALWFPVTKHWVDLVRPNLEGRALCEAVRHALDLAEAEPEYVGPKGASK